MKDFDFSKDFLTTGEYSALTGIPESTLRNYDREGVLHPAAHGTGKQSAYRFYSTMQITTVNFIRMLTTIGISMERIKELAEHRTDADILRLLYERECVMARFLKPSEDAYAVVKTYTGLIDEAIRISEDNMYIVVIEEIPIILGGINDFSDGSGFLRAYIRFCKGSYTPELNLTFPIGGFFESMDSFMRHPSQPTKFYSFDPKGHERESTGLYLNGYTRGYYGNTNDLPKRMAAYAKENNLIFNGPVYNIYLSNEISNSDPNQYLLKASAAVKEKRGAGFGHLHWSLK